MTTATAGRARAAVRRAVLDGSLKPTPCEECGFPVVDAHHEDYSRPLDVVWLCRVCHKKRHPRKAKGRRQEYGDNAALLEFRKSTLRMNGHKPTVAEIAKLWGIGNLAARSYIMRHDLRDDVDMRVCEPKPSRQGQARAWMDDYVRRYGVRPTLAEVGRAFGVSRERVRQWLNALRARGITIGARSSRNIKRAGLSMTVDASVLRAIDKPPGMEWSSFLESLVNAHGAEHARKLNSAQSVLEAPR